MRHDYYRPVSGLGEEAPVAEQALLQAIQTTAPVGVFTPWASIDDSATWVEESSPSWNYVVYALSDAALRAAEQAGGGAVGFIAVLTDRAPEISTAKAAFSGTRYEWFSNEAVFRQDQPEVVTAAGRQEPRARVLVWAREREPGDQLGGNAPVASAAQKLGGGLVFPMEVGTSSADLKPGMSATQALQDQAAAAPSPVQTQATSAGPVPAAAPHPAAMLPPGARAKALVPTLVLFGVGVGAAYMGYRLWAGSRA